MLVKDVMSQLSAPAVCCCAVSTATDAYRNCKTKSALLYVSFGSGVLFQQQKGYMHHQVCATVMLCSGSLPPGVCPAAPWLMEPSVWGPNLKISVLTESQPAVNNNTKNTCGWKVPFAMRKSTGKNGICPSSHTIYKTNSNGLEAQIYT